MCEWSSGNSYTSLSSHTCLQNLVGEKWKAAFVCLTLLAFSFSSSSSYLAGMYVCNMLRDWKEQTFLQAKPERKTIFILSSRYIWIFLSFAALSTSWAHILWANFSLFFCLLKNNFFPLLFRNSIYSPIIFNNFSSEKTFFVLIALVYETRVKKDEEKFQNNHTCESPRSS